MAEPFIGEIRPVAFNFAPKDWAKCEGQIMSIYQNYALYALLGATYGGDGRMTFGLPDFRGRCLIGSGDGRGLTPRKEGYKGGSEYVTLTVKNLPTHTHSLIPLNIKLKACLEVGELSAPTDAVLANSKIEGRGGKQVHSYSKEPADVEMSEKSIAVEDAVIGNVGGSKAHNNMQPFMTVNYIIALQGIYPSRT